MGTISNGIYAYQFLPSCLYSGYSLDVKLCEDRLECSRNMISHSLKTQSKSTGVQIVGVAKDGQLIIGPYIDGKKIDCKKLDQCNGMTLKDGSYVYVFTDTYPYSIGCFGPAMP